MITTKIIEVEYHGSIIEAHGYALIIGPSARGIGRYDLLSDVGTLIGARPESFTLVA